MDQSEELVLSYKTWKRSVDPIEKDGFREGFEEGRKNTFQLGFDEGFKSGFKLAFQEGLFCGKAKINKELYKEKLDSIGKTCIMCNETEDALSDHTLEEIMVKQEKILNQK